MARAEIDVAAPPESVWDVLADPGAYGDWVVGTQNIVRADASWPDVGSSLEFRVGIGPISMGDRTRVVEAEPPRLLVLRAELRQLGAAGIRLELGAVDDGTHVVLHEEPDEGLSAWLHTRVSDAALKARSDIALGRLKRLAEGRA
jgi:uncharacterized protein YndB with AHSA1/START domain